MRPLTLSMLLEAKEDEETIARGKQTIANLRKTPRGARSADPENPLSAQAARIKNNARSEIKQARINIGQEDRNNMHQAGKEARAEHPLTSRDASDEEKRATLKKRTLAAAGKLGTPGSKPGSKARRKALRKGFRAASKGSIFGPEKIRYYQAARSR